MLGSVLAFTCCIVFYALDLSLITHFASMDSVSKNYLVLQDNISVLSSPVREPSAQHQLTFWDLLHLDQRDDQGAEFSLGC